MFAIPHGQHIIK